ncbi:MAG: hypothetical protein JW908_08115 [Anaerolineales bacterium]|nr:hypothetical protein [Anaerolineales bacterium]
MNKVLSAFWKILLLTIVFFIVNAAMGVALPLSNDLMAAMTPEDQAAFMPLFYFDTSIKMTVLYLVLTTLRDKGMKLYLGVWLAFFGIVSMVNDTELFWYNESFPLITYLDATKMLLIGFVVHGMVALVGTWLVGGFNREEADEQTIFDAGRYGWKIGLFCILYSLFYYSCGFITRIFPEVRAFYAGWAATMEPLYQLLLFNVFRGALWFVFSLPILLGVRTRKQAFWLMPLVLFTGTAVSLITPSAFLPGIVRLAHFIELTFSMLIVGWFMVWLFVKDKKSQGKN